MKSIKKGVKLLLKLLKLKILCMKKKFNNKKLKILQKMKKMK